MSTLAVLHPDLTLRGGAESVCLHTLAALEESHDITLFTATDTDLDRLNQFYGTDVSDIRIRRVGPFLDHIRAVLNNRLQVFQVSLFARRVRRRLTAYDAVVSTKNEFAVDVPSVQYVHNPQFSDAAADPGLHDPSALRRAYVASCRLLARFDPAALDPNTTLVTNSQWSARILQQTYDLDARVVYPPVPAVPDGLDWSAREPGFLTIGRIGPSKRIHRAIDLVTALRERDHDVHLHIIGPTTNDDYSIEVETRAADLPYVYVEGAVSRDRLVDLMGRHRYGFHGREYEHFGIAVAEMVAAGMLPFVHDSGGPPEIVGGCERLRYDSQDDALQKMETLVSDTTLARRTRNQLPDAAERFGVDRFQREMDELVREQCH
jgi:glycosyltransferase involved in cell wall biosynthesis